MNSPLHRQNGHTVDLTDHESPGMALSRRAHETRNILVGNADSLFEVVSESAQSTTKDERYARLGTDSRSDNPRGVFGAFVKTCACHSLNHLLLFLIRNAEGPRRPGRSNKARQHHNGQDV